MSVRGSAFIKTDDSDCTDVRTGNLYSYNATVGHLFVTVVSELKEDRMNRCRSLLLAGVLSLAALIPAAWAQTAPAPSGATTQPPTVAGPATPAPGAASLEDRIQDAKADMIRLNRDLLVLEEELLFPTNAQVAIFVSMDVGKPFTLDSVRVTLDDKDVAAYLYTPLEVQALHRGGVQRLYVGNLRAGSHELAAFFTGNGPQDRDYKRSATVKIDKGTDPKYIELRIKDSTGRLQPEFEIKVWP